MRDVYKRQLVAGEIAIVGQPTRDARRVCRRGDTGEAHREVVDRLHHPARGRRDRRLAVHEIQHLSNGIGAGGRRSTARLSNEGEDL